MALDGALGVAPAFARRVGHGDRRHRVALGAMSAVSASPRAVFA